MITHIHHHSNIKTQQSESGLPTTSELGKSHRSSWSWLVVWTPGSLVNYDSDHHWRIQKFKRKSGSHMSLFIHVCALNVTLNMNVVGMDVGMFA